MALEWLPHSLAGVLKDSAGRGPTLAGALRVTWQVANALRAVHERGIVHRDLKPANVLLDVGDLALAQTRLADFGLAAVRGQQGPEIGVLHVSTGGSAVLGTYEYMAPEQWMKSKDAGPKADVYALGVLLFQMLAGRLPFRPEHPKDFMCLHLFEDPPLHLLDGRAPPAVRDLVGRMLSKAAAPRPSAEEVIDRLAFLGDFAHGDPTGQIF
jgi:serine/threonine-protein kinase